ncbi:MAG: ATP-binding protein [Elusimicrobia bacterium]|nr:ATP-binding protein [Elusimicrobiota bacterium]
MLKERYLTDPILEDIKEKMVFVGGPRQVGKTTLAKSFIGSHFRETAYFNWDNPQERRKIISSEWPGNTELIILDEIHKYKRWKRFIKGTYDTLKDRYRFLVTGSARMNVYRKGGDSLMGRYRYYLLHPFSLAEMTGSKLKVQPFQELQTGHPNKYLDVLEKFGGFPEPLFSQNERTLRRWLTERNERLFREDIRDVEFIREINTMKLLSDMLPNKVGSLLSTNAIREDLEVSHRAASHWLDVLEIFHYHYRIYPFVRAPYRSLKKVPKLYLWDWSEIPNEAARFENLVASHLFKFVSWWHDREGYKAKLYFLRDSSQREVDFLVTVDEKPWFAMEVKTEDENISPHLKYFQERLNIPYVYQVLRKEGVDKFANRVRIISADKLLAGLV